MKKIRLSRTKKQAEPESPNRITNETVAEHRQKVLAGGRRFKYPVQYAKHRLVINTIIISVVALIAIAVVAWWQLYPTQNTSAFFYRITRVIPLPVASVDGHPVNYSDYLVAFRAQEHYSKYKEGIDLYSKENKALLDRFKRHTLDDVVADSYAAKLAKDLNVQVTPQQVDDAIARQRQSSNGAITQETYDAIILDQYGWSRDEARGVMERKLLRQEVAYKIDSTAVKLRDLVAERLKSETDFDKIVASVGAINGVKVESTIIPLVPKNNQDGGLAEMAAKLPVGKASSVFRSTTGDGYYVVKPLEKEENRISYAYLKIPLTEFQKRLAKIKSDNRIVEYIDIPEAKAPTTNK